MIKSFKGDYSFLSNFIPCEIQYKGRVYKSVEHAYMSAKNDSPEWKEFCEKTWKPGDVKKKGREVELVPDWEERKRKVMWVCLKKKFRQEPFRSKLIATGDQYIQEGNWWGDVYWGVNLKVDPPKGKNVLGRMIMAIRERLINEEL